ncbi:MAG: alpha-ketoglutarate-dependent dioxygenase AlkB [Bauldia litoralis]
MTAFASSAHGPSGGAVPDRAPLGAVPGAFLYPDFLDRAAQAALLADIRAILADAPLYTPHVPGTGRAMSVRMSNCGPLGWYTDKAQGYRYVDRHPETGRPWPAIPERVLAIWRKLAGYPADPEACLINWYDADAKMGAHRDQDEDAADDPIVSISLGDTAVFRIGGLKRGGPTASVQLRSGSVVVLSGPARHAYHGVDRILAGSSRLLEENGLGGGRINLTLRRVTRP